MTRRDKTVMGGLNEAFKTTQWAELEVFRGDDETRKAMIVENLLSRYWKPVYCYLHRKGYDNESAKDLTQGFFQEIVIEKGMLAKAEKARGKFRTFLLTALDHYTANVWHKETAKKRRPSRPVGRFSELADAASVQIPETETPDAVFLRAWVSDLLERVLQAVEEECRECDQDAYWAMFQARVLGPILEGCSPEPLDQLCRRHGISDKTKASNMIITVKRRFKRTLEHHLRRQVGNETPLDAEIDDLIRILAESSAGSR